MKRSTKYKLSSFFSLALVLILYNQCVTPLDARKLVKTFTDTKFSGSDNDTFSINDTYSSVNLKSISLEAFKSTVYNLTRKNCITCHDVNQVPTLASSDVNIAYTSLVTGYQIDYNDIANSNIVLKLRDDHHNCWGDCDSNADEMINQIDEWKKLIELKVSQASNTTEMTTSEETDRGTITLMVESGTITPPMIKESDNGVSYIVSPKNSTTKALTSPGDGFADLEFKVSDSDYYKVYMYVDAPDETSNTVFLKLAENSVFEWKIDTTKGFEWRELKIPSSNPEAFLYLYNEKDYTINIRKIAKGLKISKITFSSDPNYNPNVVEDLKAQKK